MARGLEIAQVGISADYQVLYDLLPIPAYVFDLETFRFLSVNSAAIARYGYSRDEFLAMQIDDIRPPEDVGRLRDAIAQRDPTNKNRGTWRHQTRTGEQFEVEIIADVIPFDGRAAMLAIAIDQSERRRVQEALFHSRRRLQALFDNALDAILLLNDAGQYVDVNPAGCALLGRRRDEILTLFPWDVVAPQFADTARDAWRAFLRAGTGAGDYKVQAADGSAREVECQAVAHVLPGLHLAMLRDVTARNVARRASEQRQRDLNDQLRRVSARARARREEDRTRLSRELHDQLGQALAGLKIDLCWLAERVPTQPEASDETAAKLSAMTALVDETILRVRRLSSELRPPVLDRLGLVAAIEWQIDEFRRRSGIHVRFQSRLDHIALDRGRATAVFRIFQEALSNALTHAAATQITVRLSNPPNTLTLTVSDNGRGISAEQAGSDASLGLLGMRERAELLGGHVTVRGGRPRGTIVSVSIPLGERRRTPRDPWP